MAYVVSRFPHLPETFILRELEALRAQGWDIALAPLIRQHTDVAHAEAARWDAAAWRLPWWSAAVARALGRALLRDPGAALAVWARVLAAHLTSPRQGARALAMLPKAFLLAERLRAEGIGHVHAHYATYPALVAWAVRRLTGIPYSVTVHAHDLFVPLPMLPQLIRDAALVVAISEHNRRALIAAAGPDVADRIQVVHCGVDPARYAPTADPCGEEAPRVWGADGLTGEARSADPCSEEAPRVWGADGLTEEARTADPYLDVLAVGSLQTYKGHRHLIAAVARLVAAGQPVRLRIVGDGPLRPALERQIADAGLGGAVELLGRRTQDEVAALLPTATCFAQPSIVAPDGQMEGIPVALMEALAAGLPVVASELSGVGELVRDGATGWLVPPGDEAALAAALLAVVADPQEARRRAAAGTALVRAEFDLDHEVTRLATCFAAIGTGGAP